MGSGMSKAAEESGVAGECCLCCGIFCCCPPLVGVALGLEVMPIVAIVDIYVNGGIGLGILAGATGWLAFPIIPWAVTLIALSIAVCTGHVESICQLSAHLIVSSGLLIAALWPVSQPAAIAIIALSVAPIFLKTAWKFIECCCLCLTDVTKQPQDVKHYNFSHWENATPQIDNVLPRQEEGSNFSPNNYSLP